METEGGCHLSKATHQETVKQGFKLRPDLFMAQQPCLTVAVLKGAEDEWNEGWLSSLFSNVRL